MIDYSGREIIVEGCYSCAYGEHKFTLPCGMVYENDLLTVSQDWELPIVGFMIICPKRHVNYFSELSQYDIAELFKFVKLTTTFLKELGVCKEFDVVVSEKQSSHFHIWISPKHLWEIEKYISPVKHFAEIFEFAKTRLKTNDNLKEISILVSKLREKFKTISID